jgi:hypothetical protein
LLNELLRRLRIKFNWVIFRIMRILNAIKKEGHGNEAGSGDCRLAV